MVSVGSDELAELRRIFVFSDSDGDGMITTAEFEDSIRAFGYVPSQQELKQLQATIDRAHGGRLSFDDFVTIVGLHVKPKAKSRETIERSISESFQTFSKLCRGVAPSDPAVDEIRVQDFAMFLLTRGDKLSVESARKMLNEVRINNGAIHSDDVLDALFPPEETSE